MSKSTNMLRTRRRDNNVKPNRRDSRLTRLDRKSSRGMIYENEELRLKTININAEIERGQSDIKKLKRENDMLKKEIWCLRDEYDKLDKLLKEKKIDFSSSSTTCSSSTSDTDSCSSCSEESDQVETSQNLENVQKTNMEKLQRDFDHLSVVPEENSTENSDKTSNRASLPNDQWNLDVIKADQSYPKARTLPIQTPGNFFSPIKISKSFEDRSTLYPGEFYNKPEGCFGHNLNSPKVSFQQNLQFIPVAEDKTSTDLMVKLDNCNFDNRQLLFSNTSSHSTFSNGGNLEELLQDIESISQRNCNGVGDGQEEEVDFMEKLQREDVTYLQNAVVEDVGQVGEKPYKSELSVVLMPNPMPLIGFDKYRNIQRSFDSINSKILDEMSASQQNLCIIPPSEPPQELQEQHFVPQAFAEDTPLIQITNTQEQPSESNPFFFGNIKDNYVHSDYFNIRYNPDNFSSKEELSHKDGNAPKSPNLLEVPSTEQLSSENEENLKFNTTKTELKPPETPDKPKSPKLSIRRKVSIHFKGKKDKTKKLSLDSSQDTQKPKTPQDKKHSLFDIKFHEVPKDKLNKLNQQHQKTPSLESRKSTTETSNVEAKTPTSSDSKTSNNCDKKNVVGVSGSGNEKKNRKSVSVSPDRKHVHVKEEGGKKHKKHKRSSDRCRQRRATLNSLDVRNVRERSYSVCTDRSNMMESRLAMGLGMGSSFLYDDYSDREHTSMSSCETVHTHHRKMSALSNNVPLSEKLPWCGCWGNGCL